jgi:hypothetical protein
MTELRKTFLKHVGLASGVQVVLCLVLALLVGIFSPALEFLTLIMIYVYMPTTFLVIVVGNLKGEATMGAIILGIPLGIVLYSFIFAYVMMRFRKRAT